MNAHFVRYRASNPECKEQRFEKPFLCRCPSLVKTWLVQFLLCEVTQMAKPYLLGLTKDSHDVRSSSRLDSFEVKTAGNLSFP